MAFKKVAQKVFGFWGHIRVQKYESGKSLISEELPLIKNKAVELAQYYSQESINAIKNLLSDLLGFIAFSYLILKGGRQISVLRSFLNGGHLLEGE